MVPPQRTVIEECYALVCGMVHEGITLYGPFDTYTEAKDYGDKNYYHETRGVVIMRKETEDHVGSTSADTRDSDN